MTLDVKIRSWRVESSRDLESRYRFDTISLILYVKIFDIGKKVLNIMIFIALLISRLLLKRETNYTYYSRYKYTIL